MPTASPHRDLTGRGWTMPILEEKRTAKRKERRNHILVNPTCFWTRKPEVCENRNRKWKARSLYRALEYPISDFSGGRKIQIGNGYNPKTYKKREMKGRWSGGRQKQRQRNRENRTTDTKKRMLPNSMDLITSLRWATLNLCHEFLHMIIEYTTIHYMTENKQKAWAIKVLQNCKINYLYY